MTEADPGESDEPRFLDFEDAARLAGHCRWFEIRLFEVLGGWAEAESDPRIKLLLRAHSFRHAWHADLWDRRLPVSGPLEKASLTVPAGDRVAAVVDGLTEISRSPSGVARLAGLYRVVMPGLVKAYTEHLERADPVTEGPTLRWLPLLVSDEVAAWKEGQRLADDMMGTPTDGELAESAQSAQGELARLLAAAGPIPSSLGLSKAFPDLERE